MAPWWWFPCKPKHVGAVLLILKCFNNSTFFNVVCICWKLKCWIFLVYFVNLYMFRVYLDPIIRRYNCMYTTFGLFGSSNPTSTTDSHLKRKISTNYSIHAVVPPDDGLRYARNMQRLTKYTKNKLFIKLASLCTIICRCTVKYSIQCCIPEFCNLRCIRSENYNDPLEKHSHVLGLLLC